MHVKFTIPVNQHMTDMLTYLEGVDGAEMEFTCYWKDGLHGYPLVKFIQWSETEGQIEKYISYPYALGLVMLNHMDEEYPAMAAVQELERLARELAEAA